MGLLSKPRQEAIEAGAETYVSGKPCKHGHCAPRLTSNKSCTACAIEYGRRWRAQNRERVQKHRRTYRARHSEELRSKALAVRHATPELQKARHTAYAPTRRAWRQANKMKIVMYSHVRRARQAAAPGTLSVAEVREVTRLQRGRCAFCHTREKLTVDHIVPLARGGEHRKQNIQMLCSPCNSSKGAKHPIEFAQSRGLLL